MIHRFAAPAIMLACGLATLAPVASARTDRMMEYTCPIDGRKFSALTPMSGTSFGARLDGKRIGPIAVPYPYPACPGNGFVLYRDLGKVDAAWIAKAKALAASEEYQRVRDSESRHYLAAWIADRMGEDHPVVAGLLREAAWDAEAISPRHPVYLRAAVARLRTWQALRADHDDGWLYRQVLMTELLRQAGDYDDARRTLDETPREPLERFVDKHPKLKEMVGELRRRIEGRDKTPI